MSSISKEYCNIYAEYCYFCGCSQNRERRQRCLESVPAKTHHCIATPQRTAAFSMSPGAVSCRRHRLMPLLWRSGGDCGALVPPLQPHRALLGVPAGVNGVTKTQPGCWRFEAQLAVSGYMSRGIRKFRADKFDACVKQTEFC